MKKKELSLIFFIFIQRPMGPVTLPSATSKNQIHICSMWSCKTSNQRLIWEPDLERATAANGGRCRDAIADLYISISHRRSATVEHIETWCRCLFHKRTLGEISGSPCPYKFAPALDWCLSIAFSSLHPIQFCRRRFSSLFRFQGVSWRCWPLLWPSAVAVVAKGRALTRLCRLFILDDAGQ